MGIQSIRLPTKLQLALKNGSTSKLFKESLDYAGFEIAGNGERSGGVPFCDKLQNGSPSNLYS